MWRICGVWCWALICGPPEADRRIAGADGADAVGVDAHCANYRGKPDTRRSGETCLVVRDDANAEA